MKSRIFVSCYAGLLLLLAVAFVTNTAEAYWTSPLKIDEGDTARDPQVLVKPNGNAIVQWVEDPELIGDPNVKRAMQYDVDTGWDPFELLERSDVNPRSSFTFTQDLEGNIIAGWREWDGKRYWIHTSRFDSGGSWSAPEIIDTGDRGDSSSLTITMDPAGNAIMMWRQTANQKHYTYARMFIPGTGWQESIRVLDGLYMWYKPAINANGDAIFLYIPDGTNEIYARRYEISSGWAVAEQIDMDTGNAAPPKVAMDPSGNAIAVWAENDGAEWNAYARRFEVGTGWGTAQEIGFVCDVDDLRDEITPKIAMDSSGNLISVWKFNGATGIEADKIYTKRYDVGVGWGSTEVIWTASDTYGSFGDINSIEINSHGDAVLLMDHWEGMWNIYGNYYSPENGWGTPEFIGTELNSWEDGIFAIDNTARAVIDERGNVIAIWRYYDRNADEDYPTEIIYSRQYKPGEGWKTAEARVTYHPWYRLGRHDIAEEPVISMNPIGDAFLVWIRFGMVVDLEYIYSINVARYVADRPPACEGDFDSNGDVDDEDLAVFAEDFGRSDCASGPACEGDFNTDNDVDGSDFATFVEDFGRTDCP